MSAVQNQVVHFTRKELREQADALIAKAEAGSGTLATKKKKVHRLHAAPLGYNAARIIADTWQAPDTLEELRAELGDEPRSAYERVRDDLHSEN